jgi:hypothetical protein
MYAQNMIDALDLELEFTGESAIKYLESIKKEFESFKEKGSWSFPFPKHDGEVIYLDAFMVDGKLKYCPLINPHNYNFIITDPFKIIIVVPEKFYDSFKNELRTFINSYKQSLTDELKDSFIVELKRGEFIKKPNLEEYTLHYY